MSEHPENPARPANGNGGKGKKPAPVSKTADPASFYLDDINGRDVTEIAGLVYRKDFFFAPLFESSIALEASAIILDRKYPSPAGQHPILDQNMRPLLANEYLAAWDIIGRNENKKENEKDIVKSVRRTFDDAFIGLIRFTDVEQKNPETGGFRAELSYMFHPEFQKQGYGRASVLRAVDWFIRKMDLESKRNATIIATFDPGMVVLRELGGGVQNISSNGSSHKILARLGFEMKDLIEASGYLGEDGLERSRLLMVGSVRKNILPALERARNEGLYSPDNPPGKPSLSTETAEQFRAAAKSAGGSAKRGKSSASRPTTRRHHRPFVFSR